MSTSHRNLNVEANWESSRLVSSSNCRITQSIISSSKTRVQMRVLLYQAIMKTVFLFKAITLALNITHLLLYYKPYNKVYTTQIKVKHVHSCTELCPS